MPRKKKEALCDKNFGESKSKVIKPIQRHAANARERSRMRILSKAFSKLKTTLPWVPADTKLSKLDTLRLASSYIAHLRHVLDTEDIENSGQPPAFHPLNLTWPFSFAGGGKPSLADQKTGDDGAMDDDLSSLSDY